jgi:hypothetical protein
VIEFKPFDKIARLSRLCTITEKIDGTNGVIYISDDASEFLVGSRSRWLQPDKGNDNFGFARWAYKHKDELMKLGPGSHYGEWWGQGIQRGYSLKEKRFSLFNSFRWSDVLGVRPACCSVVPVLFEGIFHSQEVTNCLANLMQYGSLASPGFMQPEGVVIYHQAAKQYFKKTILKDEAPKGVDNG